MTLQDPWEPSGAQPAHDPALQQPPAQSQPEAAASTNLLQKQIHAQILERLDQPRNQVQADAAAVEQLLTDAAAALKTEAPSLGVDAAMAIFEDLLLLAGHLHPDDLRINNATVTERENLMAERALDKARLAGIRRITHRDQVPEGLAIWGDKTIPGWIIPWRCASGRIVPQARPDKPPMGRDGKPKKYLFPKGSGGVLAVMPGSEQLIPDAQCPLVLCEGTFQALAVAAALEDVTTDVSGTRKRFAVAGMSGCDGWSSGKAPTPEFNHIPLKGRTVYVIPDRDFATNRGVYDGMKYLAEHLLSEYLAAGVKFVSLPGRNNTDGADDMLARHPADRRGEIMLRLLEAAGGKAGDLPKRPPSRRRRDSHFFDDRGTLMPATFWQYLDENNRLALSGDLSVAYYAGGVYHNGESRRFSKAITDALGDDFVPAHERTVLEIARNQLTVGNRVIPDFVDRPLINVPNGLLDLRDGKLYNHDPGFLVTTQLPVAWNPAAKCPTWEELINSALPGQIERLEDIISQMLDWTRCPFMILILYGASRAGKGLILRVIEWLIGRGNYSAVTLHQLSDNRFMAAELFGKRANIAGELKPEEVRDISVIKMITGGDPIQADKKFGATFSFYSRAFLAFSCNKLPPINETTKAFGARVAPFHFQVGHVGREDTTLEGKLRAELPGILVRLVKAWQARKKREGAFLPTDAATAAHFGDNIDHVARFLRTRTRKVEQIAKGAKRQELFKAWQVWCDADHENLTYAARTGRDTFYQKIRNQGVVARKDKAGIVRFDVEVINGGDEDAFVGDLDGADPPGDGSGGGGGRDGGNPQEDGNVEGHGNNTAGQSDFAAPLDAPTSQPGRGAPPGNGKDGSFQRHTSPPKSVDEEEEHSQSVARRKAETTVSAVPAPQPCAGAGSGGHAGTGKVGGHGNDTAVAAAAPLAAPPPPVEDPACARPAHAPATPAPEPLPTTDPPAADDLPGQQIDDFALTPPPAGKPKKARAKPPAALLTEASLGPLPIELLAVPGDTTSLVIDLETKSAGELWATPNGTGPFIRLVGTDRGISASPASLADHHGPLVAHNGFNFDFLALARHHGRSLLPLSELGLLIDTMVVALALDPPEPPADGKLNGDQVRKLYSLDNCAARAGVPGKTDDLAALAARYAKANGIEGGPKKQAAAGYGLIPRNDPDYISYLKGDITATRALFDHLCPGGELTPYIQREMRIMGRLVAGITLAGTRLDVPLTQARYDEVEARKEACRAVLIERYGLPTHTSTGAMAANPINCTGGAEAIARAAADVGLELPRTEKTGRPTTSKEHLGPMLEQARAEGNQEQVDLLETILGLTGARSVYGTALDYLQPDGRLHPQVAPLQASGRFSITGPGITVFGKRGGRVVEREIFLPDSPDHVLVSTDLAQIDMRAMAAHAQDSAYLELFAPGRDAHQEIAAAVGLTREEAKRVGHGWNYGMGINGLVGSGVGRAVAEKFDAGMRRQFPKLVAWRDRIRDMAEAGRRLDNGFGRMMRPNRERAHTQAPALMGQGTARDLMMEAVLRLPVEIVPMLRFLVHDELVFSIPLAEADRIEPLILEAMNFEWAPPGADLQVPVTADLAKRGQNWADCYRKD